MKKTSRWDWRRGLPRRFFLTGHPLELNKKEGHESGPLLRFLVGEVSNLFQLLIRLSRLVDRARLSAVERRGRTTVGTRIGDDDRAGQPTAELAGQGNTIECSRSGVDVLELDLLGRLATDGYRCTLLDVLAGHIKLEHTIRPAVELAGSKLCDVRSLSA